MTAAGGVSRQVRDEGATGVGVQLALRRGRGLTLTAGVTLTTRDLRQGVLAIRKAEGCAEPLLCDLRSVTAFNVDVSEIVGATGLSGNAGKRAAARGRVAIVTATAEVRAAAMSYRARQPAPLRPRVGIFETLEEAEGWLDAEHGEPPVRPRAMRIALRDALGSLSGVSCEVVNVSRSGALLSAFDSMRAGHEGLLSLRLNGSLIDVRVRVVRVSPAEGHNEWHIAVAFLAPTEALDQITALMRAHGA